MEAMGLRPAETEAQADPNANTSSSRRQCNGRVRDRFCAVAT
jgi:hypothetical protein